MARLINNVDAIMSNIIANGFTYAKSGNTPAVEATLLYGSKHYWAYPFIDVDEYYEYDGTFEMDGVTYFKWAKAGIDEAYNGRYCLLTTTRDFTGVDFNNPYFPVGYILDDEWDSDQYLGVPAIYYGGTTEPEVIYPTIEHHDTSAMDKNGHEFVDLGLPSGALWAKFNVGATGDSDKDSFYGTYVAWGETEGKEDYSWSTYEYSNADGTKFTKYVPTDKPDYWDGEGQPDNLTELQLSDDADHVNMGGDWHMPNNLLYWELISNTTNEWVTDYQGVTGLNGRVFTSKINGATLFIPAAGRWNGASLSDEGTNGYVWYSTLNASNPGYAMYLRFSSDGCSVCSFNRCFGYSVRAVIY